MKNSMETKMFKPSYTILVTISDVCVHTYHLLDISLLNLLLYIFCTLSYSDYQVSIELEKLKPLQPMRECNKQ